MFNLFKSNKLSSVITVIDIGSSKITCLIAKINEQNQEYEVIGNSQNISKGFRLGNVTNIEDLSTCIAKAVSASEKMAGISINKAHIVFNGGKQSSMIHNSETPIVNGEINDNEIQNERLDDVRIFEVQQTDILLKEEFKNINVEKLTLDRIKYSENGTAILYGRARTDMNVMVYLNNEFKMKTIPGKDGSWEVDLGIIPPGIYKLRIDETTINGDVKFRIETPFKQETKELLDKMFTKAITVQPGNSLWRIARRIYGKGIMYLDIYNKNSHLIKDPDLIYPGQIFSLLD